MRLLLVLLVLVLAGCADNGTSVELHPYNHVTPGGVCVWIPDELASDPDLPARLEDLDAYPPPADYVVVFHATTFMPAPTPEDPGRELAGYCFLRPDPSEIHMGATWREYGAEAWIEVYHHEVNHARTQDPLEGHL